MIDFNLFGIGSSLLINFDFLYLAGDAEGAALYKHRPYVFRSDGLL